MFRAWDHDSGGSVAVKVFPPGSAAATRGGNREGEVLTGIRHVGLVGVRDCGIDRDGCPFVVMDFVEGESLSGRLRRGPLPAGVVVDLGAVLAAALAHVHARGIVHRDVKPGNVLLDEAGRPWLADFGLARFVDATRVTATCVTATGVVQGTAAYLAPEQVRGETVGPAADVYALGLVLLEAIKGRREYEGGALESAMARLKRTPYVPPDVPDPLGRALRRMTLTEPTDRPTAAEVAAILGEPAAPDDLVVGPAWRAPARWLGPVGALAVLATAVVGGAVLLGGGDAGGHTGGGARAEVGPAPAAPAVAGAAAVPSAALAPPITGSAAAPSGAAAPAPAAAGARRRVRRPHRQAGPCRRPVLPCASSRPRQSRKRPGGIGPRTRDLAVRTPRRARATRTTALEPTTRARARATARARARATATGKGKGKGKG